MEYIKRHFRVISLRDAVLNNAFSQADTPTVAITFDDGFYNTYDVAFPVLRELNLPATVFLCTDLVDSDDTVWFCRLNDALARTTLPVFEWQGNRFSINTPAHKSRVSGMLQADLKKLPPTALITQLAQICESLGYDLAAPLPHDSPFHMLDAAAISEMLKSGLIEFGAHTASHTILARIDKARQREEITRSIAAVEYLTGAPCRFFAYPNGTSEDYNDVSMDLLREQGILAAVTTTPRLNLPDVDRFELGRYGMGADLSYALFRCKVHNIAGSVRRLFH